MEKSLLGFETVLEIINEEEVDDVCLLVVNGVVSSVVVVATVGLTVCFEILVSRSDDVTDTTG